MESEDIVFWICAATNAGIAVTLIVRYRSKVHLGMLAESKAKAIYSWLCLPVGALCGIADPVVTIALFNIPLGHGGEIIIIFAPLFNLLMSCVLIVVGRIVIGWAPVRW
jgi:hypothetical protein